MIDMPWHKRVALQVRQQCDVLNDCSVHELGARPVLTWHVPPCCHMACTCLAWNHVSSTQQGAVTCPRQDTTGLSLTFPIKSKA